MTRLQSNDRAALFAKATELAVAAACRAAKHDGTVQAYDAARQEAERLNAGK